MSRHASIRTAVIHGTTPVPVCAECSIDRGLPGLDILGIRHDHAAELAAVVRCAIRASGYTWPDGAVTVSLSPLDAPKRGAHLALPIAAAILAASGQIHLPGDAFPVGELSLDGDVVHGTRGIAAYAKHAHDNGLSLVIRCTNAVPRAYAERARGIVGLADLRTGASRNVSRIPATFPMPVAEPCDDAYIAVNDAVYEDVKYRRSILIVAPRECTRHLLAAVRATRTPLTPEEACECACIASVAGGIDPCDIMGLSRPVRTPDPSISLAGLIGGGMPVRPGEVTLAHNGVLYLGDLALWKPQTLRQLDVARKDGHVRIVRQDGAVEMPSDFQLVGHIAPCPCGHFGDPDRDCTCESSQVASWQRRIEGLRHMFDVVAYL